MARSSAQKMRDYRARKRAGGMRLVQRWLPDTRTPEFKAEARRQSLRVSRSSKEQAEIDFIEALQAENIDLPEETIDYSDE